MIAVLGRGRERLAVLVYIDDNVFGVHGKISHISDNVRDDVLAFLMLVLLLTYIYC